MAKDRYSDDYTIEVLKDTKTVNIKDNLAVDQDLTVGNNLVVSNNLTISGAVTGGIEVDTLDSSIITTGDISTSTDFNYSSEQTFINNIPILLLKTAADVTQYSSSGGIVCSLTDTLVPGYLSFNFGTMATGQWYFEFPIDDFIKNKASITAIYFLAEVDSSFSESDFDFTVTVKSFASEGSSPPTFSTVDSDSVNLVKSDGRQWLKAEVSISNPDVSTGSGGKNYFVRFAKTDSKVVIISIFKCIIEYSTDQLKEALNCTSSGGL